mmetsp:Transcript_83238/g.102010  ORF Transcript_83238/g.102010 Transcript_83238/m.102010 type:complete len:485 (+) Transcript_83238:75-1529(+)
MTTQAPGDNMQTTSASGEFGKSDFGARLDYTEQGCCVGWRDRFWAVFFYIHVIVMITLAIVLPLSGTDATANGIQISSEATGIIVTLLVQCVIGAVFGLVWLKVIQKFAEFIIKGMLFIVLICWIAVAIIGVIVNSIELIVVGILLFLINGLYTYCIWHRIPFASALLTIASNITQTFEGTICISLLMIPVNIAWDFVWFFSFFGFVVNVYIPTVNENRPAGILWLIYFLLCVSLYWGLQVIKNISHTTTCGVTATWYFSKEVHKPTTPALKRTVTTSFGSVCFGSFIVAVLQALRALLRSQRRNTLLACIVYCLLLCIERLIRYFNMYAFAQVAIYGSDFIQAAKATWGLFSSKGFSAIINDDLTGLALFCGGVLAGLCSCFIGVFGLVPAFYPESQYGTTTVVIQIIIGVWGFFLGYYLCVVILMVVRSSIVCLFVCFAEDPAALQENRPEEFGMITGAKQELQTFAQTGHTGIETEAEQKK